MALRLENEHEWTGFLLEAGIPADESAQYAKIFKDNRLRATELPDLNMDLLKSLGVTVIGDAFQSPITSPTTYTAHAAAKCNQP